MILARVLGLREGQNSSESLGFVDCLASRLSFGSPGRPTLERELIFDSSEGARESEPSVWLHVDKVFVPTCCVLQYSEAL